MKWSLHELAERKQPVMINRIFELSKALVSRDAKMILSAEPAKVSAKVEYHFGRAILKAHVKVTLVVPSSRSLVPVKLPLDFGFREVYVMSENDRKQYEREHPHGDTALNVGRNGQINFNRALVDNIILQVPPKVLSPKEKQRHLMPKGKGWQVISEDQYYRSKTESHQVDPRLAKLKDYFSKK